MCPKCAIPALNNQLKEAHVRIEKLQRWAENSFEPSGPANDVTRDTGFQTGYTVAQGEVCVLLEE
jgi:hypothetical protein